jgi:SAM-dependent methyltransferase
MGAKVADYYDRYWSAPATPRYEPDGELMALLQRNVDPTTAVLDVGCGAGNSYAPVVAARADSYVGVDVSSKAVELARAAGLDARVIDDAASLPFEDDSFDLAVCVEVFEHLFAPDRAAGEIRRLLRPGGKLVVSTPNAVYWRLRANLVLGHWNPLGDELSGDKPWRDPHIRFFSPSLMERMLREAGFTKVEVGAYGGRFLDHLTSRPTDFGQSRLYRFAERRFDSLLGATIQGLAVK